MRRKPARFVAVDQLRGCVVALVVLHHAVLAYCRFSTFDRRHYLLSTAPVVDSVRWPGFDPLVLVNDSFFMPLMFLLAGVFVWPSLKRKGAAAYLRGRHLRLGVPFVAAALIVVPLAYLPSIRLAGDQRGVSAVWTEMVFFGPWPIGPTWFIGLLLLFDVLAAAFFTVTRPRVAPLRPLGPAQTFAVLIAVSTVAYIPLLTVYGPTRWITLGPLAVQASRMLLYGTYFAAGVALGANGLRDGILAPEGELRRGWARWTGTAVALSALLIGMRLAVGAQPQWPGLVLYGLVFLLSCGAMCFALIGVFLRFGGHRTPAWDSLAANAYGIYLLHDPVVTWTQYTLLDNGMGALAKAAFVFTVATVVSWGAALALRRVPGVAQVV